MKTSTLIFLAAITISLWSCKAYYVAADFDARTAGHQTFAVLPFEMVFTGTRPEKLTEADMEVLAEAESKAFMISFYNEVLASTRHGRKPLRISLQHYDKTLSILEEHQIDIRSSWKEDPGRLAQLLGVDAVVKGRIQKHRIMSDLASYGIDIGVHILAAITDAAWFWLPEMTRSKEIDTNYSLLDREGTVLWSIAYDIDADWRRPADEIIDDINRRSVRKFPYRVD
jgi:hypothetical protein